MPTPTLQILGVYRLEVTPEVFAEQLPMYGDEEREKEKGRKGTS